MCLSADAPKVPEPEPPPKYEKEPSAAVTDSLKQQAELRAKRKGMRGAIMTGGQGSTSFATTDKPKLLGGS